jgi:hypothetical protein
VKTSTEETGSRLESFVELSQERHEELRAHFDKAEAILEEVSTTMLVHKSREEEAQKGNSYAF